MKTISVQELQQKLNDGEDVHLLDVREPDERAEFHIGGKFLPLGHIMSMQTDDIADWQQEPVVCYCRSGMRSMKAAMMLESLGFLEVYNLTGGVLAWQDQTKS